MTDLKQRLRNAGNTAPTGKRMYVDIGINRVEVIPKSIADELAEALEWALSEIDGSSSYESHEQYDNCFDMAREALAKYKETKT